MYLINVDLKKINLDVQYGFIQITSRLIEKGYNYYFSVEFDGGWADFPYKNLCD
jgi:hypothetical protein